ncbi:DUF3806 domain-containing protein [Cellulomonas hominis]
MSAVTDSLPGAVAPAAASSASAALTRRALRAASARPRTATAAGLTVPRQADPAASVGSATAPPGSARFPRAPGPTDSPVLVPAGVRPPGPVEYVWMETRRELLRGPDVDLTDLGQLAATFDDYVARWHATPDVARWDPTASAVAFGVAVGDVVIARVPGTRWAVHSSGLPRLALTHPAHARLALPVDAVAHAWLVGEPGALAALATRLSALVRPATPARRSLRPA